MNCNGCGKLMEKIAVGGQLKHPGKGHKKVYSYSCQNKNCKYYGYMTGFEKKKVYDDKLVCCHCGGKVYIGGEGMTHYYICDKTDEAVDAKCK